MMTRRQSRAAPTVPPEPRPQKRAAQATRESHKAKKSKSAVPATVANTDSRQTASEHPKCDLCHSSGTSQFVFEELYL